MKKLLPFIIAILSTSCVFGQLPNIDLVAWYPFCADTIDHGGVGYDLFNHNLTLTSDRFGVANEAWEFNGTNSGMNFSTYFPATGDVSYSCWIDPYVNQSSIILYNGDPSLNGFGLVMNNGTPGVPGNSVSLSFGGAGQFLTTPVTLNQWHHIVFTRNGNSYKLFVDTISSGFIIQTFAPMTNDFIVGQNNLTGTDAFNGRIDDIAVYSKFITPTEIGKLYRFDPDVIFHLGPDMVIATDTVTIGPAAPFVADPAYTYTWSTGATTEYDLVTPATPPGTDYTLTVTKQYGCVVKDTINVIHLKVTVNIGPRNVLLCAGDSAVLDATVVGASGYFWNTGATTSHLTIHSPGTYWVTVDSSGYTGSDTTTVTFTAPVVVTLDSALTSCNGDSITLHPTNDTSVYTSPVYLWSNGASTYSTTVGVSGLYWLNVTDGACSARDSVVVTILYDTLTLSTPNTSICQGASMTANASGNPITNFQWTPTTGIAVSNTPTPTIIADTSAYYVVTASIGDCHVKDSFYLDVQPNPTVYLGGDRTICQFDTLHLTPYIKPQWYTHYSYNWTPGTYLDNTTQPFAVLTATDTTTPTAPIHLIFTVTTPAGCTGSDSADIYVHKGDFASIVADTSVCPNDSIRLTPVSTQPGITTYTWHPATYLDDSTLAAPLIKAITNASYTIVARSMYGCLDTINTSVTVLPSANIYLGDSVIMYQGDSYQISPQTNCTSFSWFPPNGLSDTSISNPIATPVVSTKYIVHATTEQGCTTVDSLNIHINPTTVINIPNAFAPGEGANSIFMVEKSGLATLTYFRIYNRWGLKVYESTNIDSGWDGTYNGKAQPFDVYVYEIEAVTNRGKTVQRQGNVTLIR